MAAHAGIRVFARGKTWMAGTMTFDGYDIGPITRMPD
jgi:hypothetical protein